MRYIWSYIYTLRYIYIYMYIYNTYMCIYIYVVTACCVVLQGDIYNPVHWGIMVIILCNIMGRYYADVAYSVPRDRIPVFLFNKVVWSSGLTWTHLSLMAMTASMPTQRKYVYNLLTWAHTHLLNNTRCLLGEQGKPMFCSTCLCTFLFH